MRLRFVHPVQLRSSRRRSSCQAEVFVNAVPVEDQLADFALDADLVALLDGPVRLAPSSNNATSRSATCGRRGSSTRQFTGSSQIRV